MPATVVFLPVSQSILLPTWTTESVLQCGMEWQGAVTQGFLGCFLQDLLSPRQAWL